MAKVLAMPLERGHRDLLTALALFLLSAPLAAYEVQVEDMPVERVLDYCDVRWNERTQSVEYIPRSMFERSLVIDQGPSHLSLCGLSVDLSDYPLIHKPLWPAVVEAEAKQEIMALSHELLREYEQLLHASISGEPVDHDLLDRQKYFTGFVDLSTEPQQVLSVSRFSGEPHEYTQEVLSESQPGGLGSENTQQTLAVSRSDKSDEQAPDERDLKDEEVAERIAADVEREQLSAPYSTSYSSNRSVITPSDGTYSTSSSKKRRTKVSLEDLQEEQDLIEKEPGFFMRIVYRIGDLVKAFLAFILIRD